MPLIDPGVIAASPFLSSRFNVRRRIAAVSDKGRSISTDSILKRKVGIVVGGGGGNGQDRTPSATTSTSTYQITTRFPLRKQAIGILPDVVLWRGLELLVTDVVDSTQFGAGWVLATCTSDKIADVTTGSETA